MKHRIGQHKGTMVLFCAFAVTAFTMFTGVAFAAGGGAAVNGTLTAGALQINSVQDIALGSHVIDGMSGTLTASSASGTIVAQDLSGTGAGYQIEVQRSDFKANVGTTEVPVLKTLDTTMSWQLPLVSRDSSSDTTSTAPSAAAGPTTIRVGDDVVIATATAGNGMGIYDLTFGASNHKISATYDANAYAGAYSGTVTVSAVSGPDD